MLKQFTIAALTVMVAATAQAQPGDREFVRRAAVSNAFEIQSSNVALRRASRDDVRSFAQRMIDDHTRASNRLAAAASRAGVPVPAGLDARHKAKLFSLRAKRGAAFDQAYIAAQSAAHAEAVTLFRTYSRSGANPALRRTATALLPNLVDHRRHVRELAGGGARRSAGAQ